MVKIMSKKNVEAAVESMENINPETGLILELIGKTLKSKWQENNGVFFNAETRKDMKNKPLALVEDTDIQIRVGNRLITVRPAEEGKPVVSIPVGMSDKTTPATIPKDWLMGMLLDGIIVMCEGDTHIALKYIEGINCAINNAIQINEDGRMKIDQKLLPEPHHAVEIAEMLDSLKRTFKTKSAGTAKLNFTFDVQDLEPVEEIVEEVTTAIDRLEEYANNLKIPTNEPQEVIEVNHTPFKDTVEATDEVTTSTPDPFPLVVSEIIEDEVADDPTEIPVVELTPLDDEDTINYNFKKHPLHSITQDMVKANELTMTADELADIKGVHVQTIKRALDTMEKTDGVDILYDGEAWNSMMLETIPGHYLFVSCTRSKTGRYARGSPIVFKVILENSPEYEATRILFTTLPPMQIEEALEHVVDADAFDARAEAEAEWAALENDMEAIPDEYFLEDEPSALEQVVVEKKGICVQCSKKGTMFIETPVGGRMFCSEKCWAEYVGEPVMPEGHYGLKENVAIPKEELPVHMRDEDEVHAVLGGRTEDVHDIRGMMGVN
tara:strand:+ start:456 stop:2111 length:1656 start_codon:yes stop_codon:yes gene_type:complete